MFLIFCSLNWVKEARKNYLCTVKQYFFNYTHDLALACAPIYYNPSATVAFLERDLMPLAAFCAKEDDCVVVEESRLDACRNFYQQCPSVCTRFVPSNKLLDCEVEPWGWDSSLVRRISKGSDGNTPMPRVPSAGQLELLREFSSRRWASECLSFVRKALPEAPLCGESCFCETEEGIKKTLQAWGSQVLLKAPYSSSGRGLRMAAGGYEERLQNWCRNLLEHQGGVEVEPCYDKVFDLAAEFCVHPSGEVEYLGLSLFRTTGNGAYEGNLVASQTLLFQKLISAGLDAAYRQVLQEIQHFLGANFKVSHPCCLGVDMMVCRNAVSSQLLLHPCVEINVRRTMGLMAINLARLIDPEKEAFFQIRYFKQSVQLTKFVANLAQPQFSAFGKLLSGTMLLNPVEKDSHYAAWLEIS